MAVIIPLALGSYQSPPPWPRIRRIPRGRAWKWLAVRFAGDNIALMAKRTFDVRQLRALPVSERLKLIDELWDSVIEDAPDIAFPMTPQLAAELDRRLAEHDADPSSAIPWVNVRDAAPRRVREGPN